jgi:hypothetical protein
VVFDYFQVHNNLISSVVVLQLGRIVFRATEMLLVMSSQDRNITTSQDARGAGLRSMLYFYQRIARPSALVFA